MKRIKQKAWRLSLKLMWLAIVFLVSCRSNQEQKNTAAPEPQGAKDSTKTAQTEAVKDTIKQIEEPNPIAKPIKKKPIAKKDTLNKPIRQDPGPVCKYGVIRKVTPVGDGN